MFIIKRVQRLIPYFHPHGGKNLINSQQNATHSRTKCMPAGLQCVNCLNFPSIQKYGGKLSNCLHVVCVSVCVKKVIKLRCSL